MSIKIRKTSTHRMIKKLAFIDKLLNEIFGSSTESAKTRLYLFLIIVAMSWSLFALYLQPLPVVSSQNFFSQFNIIISSPLVELYLQVAAAYFTSSALLRMYLIVLAFLAAYEISQKYFAYLHEIKNPPSSRKILSQILFRIPRPSLYKIQDDQISSLGEDQVFFLVGGPARMQIGLENAAIFEQADGSVEVVGPTHREKFTTYLADNFEQLRSVINLRNQNCQFDLFARSKDGIPIIFRSANMTFSVKRTTTKVTLTRPYPFNDKAIFHLAYRFPKGEWQKEVVDCTKQIFINKISQHNFSEFLDINHLENINHDYSPNDFLKMHQWAIRYRDIRRSLNPRKHLRTQGLMKQKGSHQGFRKTLHRKTIHYNLCDTYISQFSKYQNERDQQKSTKWLCDELLDEYSKFGLDNYIQIEGIDVGFIEIANKELKNHLQDSLSISTDFSKNRIYPKNKQIYEQSRNDEFLAIMHNLFPEQTPDLIRDQAGQKNLMTRFLLLLQHAANEPSISNRIGKQQLFSAIEVIQGKIDSLE
jgi:hypothetical protein